MNQAMPYIFSFIAGGVAAFSVGTAEKLIAQKKADEINHQQLLQQIAEPGPSTPPPLFTPADGLPTPGTLAEPGSARPTIQFRQGVSEIRIAKAAGTVELTGDPIWRVQLIVNGKPVDQLPALIGRANRQALDRHVAGNKSPLPPGQYRIERTGIELGPFSDAELGRGYWVPISPLFATQRSALGFHQDPSWGKKNGESGTSGCIGLQSPEATQKLVNWIKQFNVQQVVVES